MFTPLKVKALITETIFQKAFRQILIGFLMLVFGIWSISMIRMGILYQNDCPYGTDKDIPRLQTSLILLGACLLGLISAFFSFNMFAYLRNVTCLIENRDSWRYLFYYSSQGFTFFFFALLFAISVAFGLLSVFTGSINLFVPKNAALTFTNSSSDGYCDESFFSFSFWSFTSIDVILGVLIIIGFICSFCEVFEDNVKEQRPNNCAIKHQQNRNVPTNTKID